MSDTMLWFPLHPSLGAALYLCMAPHSMYNTVARKGFIHVMHKPQSVFSLDVGEKNLLMEIPTSFSLVSLLHFYVLVK